MPFSLSVLRLAVLAIAGSNIAAFPASAAADTSFLRGVYAAAPDQCDQARLVVSERSVRQYADGALDRRFDVVDYLLTFNHENGRVASSGLILQLIADSHYYVLHLDPTSNDHPDQYRTNWFRSDKRIMRAQLSEFVEQRAYRGTIVEPC